MDHKEKCKVLKGVRKQIADKLGIDLHQTECTYEGECSGTCPKCAKEEKTLNKALLSGAVIASSIALCACNVTADVDNTDKSDKDKSSKKSESKGKSGKTKNSKKASGKLASLLGFGEDETGTEPDELAGATVCIPNEYDPDDYDGGLDYIDDGSDIEELAGDVVMEAWTYDELCMAATNYCGAPICEVDHEDDDGNVIIHCYEIVDNGDEIHTATVDWLTVNPFTTEATNFMGETVYLNEYM